MNKIKTVFLLALFVSMNSCSSNEDDDPVDTIVEEAPSVLRVEVNGVETYNGGTTVFKTESKMAFGGCQFDTSGRLAFLRVTVPTGASSGEMRTFTTFKYFNSHYFTFNLESLDEVNKRVKGSFAGYLYANPTDLNSEKKYVNGTFDLKYQELVPGVFGLKNQAKINGNSWVKVYRESSSIGGSYTDKVTHQDYSDDEYKITINYEFPNYASTLPAVTYSFGSTAITNNVRVAKYDVTTGTLINYNTTGIFVISKYENNILTGSYSFTGVNPNNSSDIIQVTDGDFKMIHNYY